MLDIVYKLYIIQEIFLFIFFLSAMGNEKNLDLFNKLSSKEQAKLSARMETVSPDDGKYAQEVLTPYLSPNAEWEACAYIQSILLKIRAEMWQAGEHHVKEVEETLSKINPANITLLENNVTHHDQLAVLDEIWRHVSPETKALLHPWTTSYDILDTARSYLLKKVYTEKLRPIIATTIEKLNTMAENLIQPTDEGKIPALQAGRTHLQKTSPVPFGTTLTQYAARLADRLGKCDSAFSSLKGKISGIVGTGASVEMVIGEGKSLEFEQKVLAELGLEPDYTATQIVQKESLTDVGHSLVSLMNVLKDFANDMRLLYSSDIGEVTSRDGKARLWGSSADASKNNPINRENISGKAVVVESWMRVLYEMISSDLQRDLRGSVQARYQPNLMITEIYESFSRANKALNTLSINEDVMERSLQSVRNNPSEALVAILRGESGWVHSRFWVGHDFVKEMAKKRQAEGNIRRLIDVALEDEEFNKLYDKLPPNKQAILQGELEKYIWTSLERAKINIQSSRDIIANFWKNNKEPLS